MEPVYLPPPISKPVHDIEMEKAIKKGETVITQSPLELVQLSHHSSPITPIYFGGAFLCIRNRDRVIHRLPASYSQIESERHIEIDAVTD